MGLPTQNLGSMGLLRKHGKSSTNGTKEQQSGNLKGGKVVKKKNKPGNLSANKKKVLKSAPAPKKSIEDMDMDDFMRSGVADERNDDDMEFEEPTHVSPTKAATSQKGKMSQLKRGSSQSRAKGSTKTEKSAASSASSNKPTPASAVGKHKEALAGLAKSDPEFFQFLQQEDKGLLAFDESEDSDSDGGDDDDDEEEDITEESEEKAASSTKKGGKEKSRTVTTAMVNSWSRKLQDNPTSAVIGDVVAAFRAAVQEAQAPEEEDKKFTKFKVTGSDLFNSVIRICLLDLLPALTSVLHLTQPADDVPDSESDPRRQPLPSSSKHWSRVRDDIRLYLEGLIELVKSLAEPQVVNSILKHISQSVPFYCCFPKICRKLAKCLISVWSSGEETSRVLAFLSIVSILRRKRKIFEEVIKKMYVAYVRNCRFTSPTTVPLITFMQRSLAETMLLNEKSSYGYAFVYLRQLAIHLRTAITTQKKDAVQTVYNWQFIHSLRLWSRVVCMSTGKSLQSLVYPLVQVTVGTIGLIPSAKYYPLRFQCVRILNMVTEETGKFIPVLPYLTAALDATTSQSKNTKIKARPVDFACILKFSKSQMNEKITKTGVMEQVYELMLHQFNIHSHTIGFPELTFPIIIQLKQYLKTCRSPENVKQIKQLVQKVEENVKFISDRRSKLTVDIREEKAVAMLEGKIRSDGTPLSRYYAQYRAVRDKELQLMSAAREQTLTVQNLDPEEARKQKMIKMRELRKSQKDGQFQEDDESDSEMFGDSEGADGTANGLLVPQKKKSKPAKEKMIPKKVEVVNDDDDNEDSDDVVVDFDEFDSDSE